MFFFSYRDEMCFRGISVVSSYSATTSARTTRPDERSLIRSGTRIRGVRNVCGERFYFTDGRLRWRPRSENNIGLIRRPPNIKISPRHCPREQGSRTYRGWHFFFFFFWLWVWVVFFIGQGGLIYYLFDSQREIS